MGEVSVHRRHVHRSTLSDSSCTDDTPFGPSSSPSPRKVPRKVLTVHVVMQQVLQLAANPRPILYNCCAQPLSSRGVTLRPLVPCNCASADQRPRGRCSLLMIVARLPAIVVALTALPKMISNSLQIVRIFDRITQSLSTMLNCLRVI